MKKRDYLLVFVLIILIAAILYWMRQHRRPVQAEIKGGGTEVPAEVHAPEVLSSVTPNSLAASADSKAVVFRPPGGVVLYSRPPGDPAAPVDNSTPLIRELRAQRLKNPAAEYDSLKELKSVTFAQLKNVAASSDGGTDFELGDSMTDRLIAFGYFADRTEGVRFYLLFDLQTGEMQEQSCFAYKGEVFRGPEKEFSVRSDNEDYIVIAGGDKYYLRAKYTGLTGIGFEGLLYQRDGDNWREISVFNAYGTQQKRRKMDLALCQPQ